MSSRNNSRNIIYKKQLVKKKMMSLIFYGMIFVICTVAFFFLNASSAQNVLDLAVCVKDQDLKIEELKYELKVPQSKIKGEGEEDEEKEAYIASFSSLQGGFTAKKFIVVSEEDFKNYGKVLKKEVESEEKNEKEEVKEETKTEEKTETSEEKKEEEKKEEEKKGEDNKKEEETKEETKTAEKAENKEEVKEEDNKKEETEKEETKTEEKAENKEEVKEENKTKEETKTEEKTESKEETKSDEKEDYEEEIIKHIPEDATEINPGDNLELKDDQVEDGKIYLIAVYETKEQKGKTLYNKKISSKNEKNTIIVSGFMPMDAELRIKEIKKEDVEGKIKEKTKTEVSLSVAYDIKILVGEKEYEPTDFDEKVNVRILGLENETINIWHVKDDENVEIMDTVRNGKSVTYGTESFSVYGIEVLETSDQESIIVEESNEVSAEDEPKDIIPNVSKREITIEPKRSVPPNTNEGDQTLTINDFNSDKNYYLGKNYTDNMAGTNLGTYTNFVKVTINYYGYAQGTTSSLMKGRISLTERQDIVQHIRCYPRGSISAELMDNPFMDMPLGYSGTGGTPDTGYGFGGWSNPSTGTISTNSKTKVQTLNLSATSDVTVNVYANWVQANVVYLDMANGYDTVDGVNNNGTMPETPVGSWGRAFTVLNTVSNNKTDRERNIIVLVGDADSGINLTKAATGTSGTVTDVEYTSSTTFTPGGTYILSTGTGAGSYALATTGTGGTNIGRVQLAANAEPSTATQWVISASGSGYTIRNVSTNQYLYAYYSNGWGGGYSLRQRNNSYTWTYDATNRRFYGTVNNRTRYIRYSGTAWGLTDTASSAAQFNFITFTSTQRQGVITTRANDFSLNSNAGNVAVTVTSLYGHVDYRPQATLSLPATTRSINYEDYYQGDFDIGKDFQMHHVAVNATGYHANTQNTSFSPAHPVFYGNGYNARLGRGITCKDTSDTGTTFVKVVGGTSSTTSSDAYKLVVESGKYCSILGHNDSGTLSYYGTVYLTLGSDVDRANNVHTNLSTYYRSTMNSGGGRNGSTSNTMAYLIDVKSGRFGMDYFETVTSSERAYAGIYLGGYGTSSNDSTRDYSDRYCIVEGGKIANLIGGLKVYSTDVETRIYVKGGTICNIVGGAGRSTTYGDRMIQITGGTIEYSVSGGSNGFAATGNSEAGEIENCDTLVYIGGNAQIGLAANLTGDGLYGVKAGCVLGAGNGRSGYERYDTGKVDNSHVIINDSAHVLGSVYGGGNIGTIGNSSETGETIVEILGGTVDGNVYGGSNENSIYGKTTINVKGGQVKGAVYGGSNTKGTITQTTTINVTGGTLGETSNATSKEVLFGGGYGANTVVTGNAIVNIRDTDGNVNIYGSSYGGSSLGTMSANTTVNIEDSTGSANTINIVGNVFAGGKGTGTPGASVGNAYVAGDATINVDGSNLPDASIFGGYDVNGEIRGDITVNIGQNYTSKVGNVYGGGNLDPTGTEADTVKVYLLSHADVTKAFNGGKSANLVTGGNTDTTRAIYLQGGNATNIFGGSDTSGTVTASHVYIQSGTATNVYGGNNEGGQTTTSFVYVTGGTVTNVYGGGYEATTPTTNVSLTGGTVTNGFGGGYGANVTTSNINLNGTTATNIYGGSNSSGTVTTSNVSITTGTTTNTYGGNNAGGTTTTSNVNVTGGTSTNVFGGNNAGGTTGTSIVNVTGGTVTDVFGGNNLGGSTGSTNVVIDTTTIRNVYGGGNRADTTGNTNVYLKSATLTGSAFGGGNGRINFTEATVYGNSTLKIEGTTSVAGDVFGGGNAAANGPTGGNALTTVLMTGGTITGDLYGAANTSVVNGNTLVKIGSTAVNDNTMVTGPISIGGTVFGGGKSNAAGSANYDFSFESVTGDANIYIYATNYSYNNFVIGGSVFGSGNAAMISGDGNVIIKDYGTLANIKDNVSIQRATSVTLDNCNIHLTGTTDTTNEIATAIYTFNRIDELILKNNTTLHLDNGVNITSVLRSVTSSDALATVGISSSGITSRNVDNRIYIRQGKNIILRTEDKSNGEVHGMTYFGIYTLDEQTHARSYGIYDRQYTHGNTVSNDLYKMFSRNSYVQGQHYQGHNIQQDGFYTNYYDGLPESSSANIKTAYIIPTPDSANYYQWIAGKASSDIFYDDIELISTKYATTAAYVLYLDGLNYPNMRVEVKDFEITNLDSGITLKDPSTIPNIANLPAGISPENNNMNLAPANTEFGLTMTAGNTGWQTRGHADFLTSPSSSLTVPDDPNDPNSPTTTYTYGSTTSTSSLIYTSDNSNTTPTFSFYMEHSKNISYTDELGTVTIHLEATYIDEHLQAITKNAYIIIKLSINNMVNIDNDYYEGAITPGKEYAMFPTTPTNITKRSSFSAYYSLYVSNFSQTYYDRLEGFYYHALSSSTPLPVGTKITLIDMSDTSDIRYYYYIIPQADQNATKYRFSNFKAMDSEQEPYRADGVYYDDIQDLVYEQFIVHVDFEDTNLTSSIVSQSLVVDLIDIQDDTVTLTVNISQYPMKFSVYHNLEAQATINLTLNKNIMYTGEQLDMDIVNSFALRQTPSGDDVFDTSHLNDQLGVRFTFSIGNNSLTRDQLAGVYIRYNNHNYFANADGTFRIKIADVVANVLASMELHTENGSLGSGTYTIKAEAFGSYDGTYFSDTIAYDQEGLQIVSGNYGLSVDLSEDSYLIDHATGKGKNNSNQLNFNIGYSGAFTSPKITVKLLRRTYGSPYVYTYEEKNLASYTSTSLTATATQNEYLVTNSAQASQTFSIVLRENLTTGTYKFIFTLYDGTKKIADMEKMVIIK